MMAGRTQPITAEVLVWALDAAGFSPSKLADQIPVSTAVISSWLTGEASPNQGQLAKLAKALGRSPSFFYLPKPPADTPASARFRKFAGRDDSPSLEAIEKINLALRIQTTAKWVRQATDKSYEVSPPDTATSDNVEVAAERLRVWLGWTESKQVGKETTDSSVAKAFRSALEGRGVIVLHLTLDEDVTRGFSLSDPVAPLVAINTKDDPRARLFSYAHELVHLSLRSTVVCESHENADKTERFCNRVAASLLMPANAFTEYVLAKLGKRRASSIDDVSAIRPRFHVSLRAAAIRAESLGLGIPGLYDLVRDRAEVRKQGGVYTPGNERTKPRVRVDEYGSEFIRTVDRGVRAGVLREVQAAELLRLSQKEWVTARSLAGSSGNTE